MTVPSTPRRAGPFTGTGVLVSYPFTFKVFERADLMVVTADTNGLETEQVIDSGFLATLNVDQDTSPGGSVQYALSGVAAALPVGYRLAITGEGLAFDQPADLPQGGNFSAEVVENAFDRTEMQIQNLADQLNRTLQVAATSNASLALPAPVAGQLLGWNATLDGLINYAPDADSAAGLQGRLANPLSAVNGPSLVAFNPTLTYGASTVGQALADRAFCPKDYPWLAAFDGVTDDTAAINACATAARAAGNSVVFPRDGTAKISGSLDFSGLQVIGYGRTHIHLQATSAQFDVITTTGNTTLNGLYVHGGWDGATAGQSGDAISIKATNPAFPYNVHLRDCVILNAKKRGIYWERGGYSSVYNTRVNACGLHALELFGNSGGSDSTTTVSVSGFSVFSDCPYGYGVKMTECINVSFDCVISEYTKGIQLMGGTNRAISLRSFYQEFTSGLKFIDWSTASCIGFEMRGCFGGGGSIDYNANILNQAYGSNSNLTEPAIPFDGQRLILVDGGEFTTSASGSVTAASISLPPGTWSLTGYVQTVNSASATITQLGGVLTTNVAAAGVNNTTSTLNFGSDEQTYNPGANADLRVQPTDVVQNTSGANVDWYLRAYIGRTAGTVAYRGGLKAVRIS